MPAPIAIALGACLAVAWPGAASGAPAVRPSEAIAHLGESVVVEGHVDTVVCSPQACLLSFEPGFSGLVVAIPGDAVGAFPDPDATYEARRVRVRGTIEDRGGRPRMEVRDPTAIALAEGPDAGAPAATPVPAAAAHATKRTSPADGTPPAPASEARAPGSRPSSGDAPNATGALAGQVQVHVEGEPPQRRSLSADEAARKLGLDLQAAARQQPASEQGAVGTQGEMQLLRDQLSAIASRLASLEARLDEIDERVAAVEEIAGAATADAVAAPSVPAYVVSGAGSSRLHRVQSGWSVDRVVRVMGEPLQVTGQPPGPFTWYYGGGRAITIDEHGRVASFVGF